MRLHIPHLSREGGGGKERAGGRGDGHYTTRGERRGGGDLTQPATGATAADQVEAVGCLAWGQP
jgi:hypothetical protein